MTIDLGTLSYDIGLDTSKLKKASKEVKKNNKAISKSFASIGSAIAAAISFEAVRRMLMLADSVKLLDARIKNLSKSEKEFTKSRKELLATANKTGTMLEDNIRLFESLKIASEDLGRSNKEVLELNETIQQLGIIGSSSQDAMSNAMRQFGQAMAGGIVRAEEFNSIVENTPLIAKAIAEGLGTTTGQLRKMVIEGKLLSKDVFESLLSQTDSVNERFDKMPLTLNRAANVAKNNFMVALGDINDELQLTNEIAELILGSAKKMGGIGKIIIDSIKTLRTLFISLFAGIDMIPVRFEAAFKMIPPFFAKLVVKLKNKVNEIPKAFIDGFLDSIASVNFFIGKVFEKVKLKALAKTFKGGAKEVENFKAKINELAEAEKRIGEEIVRLADKDIEAAKKVRDIKLRAIDEVAIAQITANEKVQKKRFEPVKKAKPVKNLGAEIGPVVSDLDKLKAKMGDETLAIENAFRERNAKILKLTKEGEEDRSSLLLKSETMRATALQELEDRRFSASIDALSSFNNSLLMVIKKAGKEQTFAGKALFLANQGLQVAQIVANTLVGSSQALALGPAGIPLAALIKTTGFASAAILAGLSIGDLKTGGGRQSGGRVSQGSIHPITEDGQPEVLQQGARQFLIPGKGGNIIPAKDMKMGGGGGAPNITVVNNGAPIDIESVNITKDEVVMIVNQSKKETVDQINGSLASGRGSTFQSLRQGSKVERNIR